MTDLVSLHGGFGNLNNNLTYIADIAIEAMAQSKVPEFSHSKLC